MKKKTILMAIGIILILVLSTITAVYLHFKPLLEDGEMKEVKSGLLGISCIGKGCHSFSASSTSGFGGIDCRGYQFFYICLSDAEKYCKYFKPFEPREKCICEVKSTTESRDSFKKFCPQNNLCYGNSFEYEFGCSGDIGKTCRERERELGAMPSCYNCMDPFIKKCSDCDKSWIERYSEATEAERIDIFNRGEFTNDPSPLSERRMFLKPLCTLLCKNCNTTLCGRDNLCEHAFNSSNNSN